MIKKVEIYDLFLDGVKESFGMILNIFPTFVAMILAVNIFTDSGLINYIFNIIKKFLCVDFPIDIIPLALIRPISGTASTAYLNTIYTKFGPDSFIGLLGSVMQGSTDTTFYVLSLYFSTVGIKKIRYSLFVGLCADIIGIIASIIFVNLLF